MARVLRPCLGAAFSKNLGSWSRQLEGAGEIRAERATEKALHNCAFAWGDVLNLPQPDNSFSQLVASRLFTILSERERAVGEIFRVLIQEANASWPSRASRFRHRFLC